MNLSMNEVQSNALAKYNIHDYLDDEKSATSWNVEKGSAVLHQLMKEQDKLASQRNQLVKLAEAHGVVEKVSLTTARQVITLTKVTSHLFRALSTVLATLGALPDQVDGKENLGLFGDMGALPSQLKALSKMDTLADVASDMRGILTATT